jgi:quercetin dioxygenase-like cupin family protein
MATLDAELQRYEELALWHQRQPFNGVDPYPTVIREEDAFFQSWAFGADYKTPCWIYLSTCGLNAGTFSVPPGDYFEPGNHPGPEPYYILKGQLHLCNPDTGQVLELNAGDASNIPAFEFHTGYNFGDEEVAILWFVPGEMHTEAFRRDSSVSPYPRRSVTVGGPVQRQEGFPSKLAELASWPASARSTTSEHHLVKLDRSTWCHTIHGVEPRFSVLTSWFYTDERIRCGLAQLPVNRKSEPDTTLGEKVYFVTSGDLIINIVGTGQSLRGRPDDMVYVPAGIEHHLQAIGDRGATSVFAISTESLN